MDMSQPCFWFALWRCAHALRMLNVSFDGDAVAEFIEENGIGEQLRVFGCLLRELTLLLKNGVKTGACVLCF